MLGFAQVPDVEYPHAVYELAWADLVGRVPLAEVDARVGPVGGWLIREALTVKLAWGAFGREVATRGVDPAELCDPELAWLLAGPHPGDFGGRWRDSDRILAAAGRGSTGCRR